VAGTHLTTRIPTDEMVSAAEAHPREVLLLGKAGDGVVFNSHTWHGGTLNRTDRPRRAMHGYFCRRRNDQQLNQKNHLSPETVAGLSSAVRFLLDV
jgi:ectoine hydroxylase-related dioxygenase (phytanoyl-CoA dioxygenase family)